MFTSRWRSPSSMLLAITGLVLGLAGRAPADVVNFQSVPSGNYGSAFVPVPESTNVVFGTFAGNLIVGSPSGLFPQAPGLFQDTNTALPLFMYFPGGVNNLAFDVGDDTGAVQAGDQVRVQLYASGSPVATLYSPPVIPDKLVDQRVTITGEPTFDTAYVDFYRPIPGVAVAQAKAIDNVAFSLGAAASDTTPPDVYLLYQGKFFGYPLLEIYAWDDSGLASVQVTTAVNVAVYPAPFTPGSQSAAIYLLVIDRTQPILVAGTATDIFGNTSTFGGIPLHGPW